MTIQQIIAEHDGSAVLMAHEIQELHAVIRRDHCRIMRIEERCAAWAAAAIGVALLFAVFGVCMMVGA